jgi:hypothetical protein
MNSTSVYINRRINDDLRRARIFDGSIFLYSAPAASNKLAAWAIELIDRGFATQRNVRRAHLELTVQEFVNAAGPMKSTFTNHPRTKQLCQELIVAMGCDPELTYFDLPRLRVAPPGQYLTSGVSYAYKAHRDTWYAHPRQLVNYWVPLFDAEVSHVMPMYLDYFRKPVRNASEGWDYDEWVKNARYAAVQNLHAEKRQHPVPHDDLSQASDVRFAQNGGDIMMFSTCHLHGSPINDSDVIRYSYDLRTLHLDDLRENRGPENVDGKATGSTLKDFLRVSDLAPLEPEKLLATI